MEKNITALQHVRSKSKQRVTLQNIFRFINKGALTIDSEHLEDLEIDGRIYKARGLKMLHFLLIPLTWTAIRMMGRIT